MKIILKISMICGLLLSAFGTVQAARKYAPGVAMRMATTGNFDSSESDQILADIPEEWKKEHRAIVRQMMNGTRGRGAKRMPKPEMPDSKSDDFTTTDLEFKDDISEFQEKNLGMKPFEKTEENSIKSVENDLRLAKLMKSNLDYFIDKKYNNFRQSESINKPMDKEYFAKKFAINSEHFNDDYASLIVGFNNLLIKLNSGDNLDESKKLCIKFLEVLSTGVEQTEDVKKQCLAIVQVLSMWNKKYLNEKINDNNEDFTLILNEYINKFDGEVVQEDKQSTTDLIITMKDTLNSVINLRYDKKKGAGLFGYGSHWGPKNDDAFDVKNFLISTDKVKKDDMSIAGLFNSIITGIGNDKDDNRALETCKYLINQILENSIKFVNFLKTYRNDSNKAIEEILNYLTEWNDNRVRYVFSKADEGLTKAIAG